MEREYLNKKKLWTGLCCALLFLLGIFLIVLMHLWSGKVTSVIDPKTGLSYMPSAIFTWILLCKMEGLWNRFIGSSDYEI